MYVCARAFNVKLHVLKHASCVCAEGCFIKQYYHLSQMCFSNLFSGNLFHKVALNKSDLNF